MRGGMANPVSRTPLYFLSHGGVSLSFPLAQIKILTGQPSLIEEPEHPAYGKLQEIGREITEKVKPEAVVIFSAHWQGGKNRVLVNTAEITDLIYEYV